MPKRIQRKRARGWRMPEGAIYVGRPTKWGNPSRDGPPGWMVKEYRRYHQIAADNGIKFPFEELRGKDLACWCPLDQPCHADVLLELANSPALSRQETGNNGSR